MRVQAMQIAVVRAKCDGAEGVSPLAPRRIRWRFSAGIGHKRTMPRPARGRPGHLCGQSSVCMRGWRDYEKPFRRPKKKDGLLGSVKEVIQPQVPLRLPC